MIIELKILFPLKNLNTKGSFLFYGTKKDDKILNIKKIVLKKDNVTIENDFSPEYIVNRIFNTNLELNYLIEKNLLEIILKDNDPTILKKEKENAPKNLKLFLQQMEKIADEIIND